MKLRWIWNSFSSIFRKRAPKAIDLRNEDRLLRRLLCAEPWIQCEPTGAPTSGGFSLRPGEKGLSADLERLTTAKKAVQDARKYRLFALPVGKVRALRLVCWYDPLPDNAAHCQFGLSEQAPPTQQVPGWHGQVKFNRTMQRALRDMAVPVPV